MTRVYTKIGDVFSVKLNKTTNKYFQFIARDLNQLNSDVIRAFKKVYPIKDNQDLSVIVQDEVEFYAHCFIKIGVKIGYWEKVGSTKELGNFENILFRTNNRYVLKENVIPGISLDWMVWKINDKNIKTMSELDEHSVKAELGLVVTPEDICERMKTGKYNFAYP